MSDIGYPKICESYAQDGKKEDKKPVFLLSDREKEYTRTTLKT
jgi:hypothetical protein